MLKQLLSFTLTTMLITSATAVEIIAHRGASHDAPENTLSAFKLGWEQKADGVELDIYLSKDGRIVVMHDDNTKRTAGVDKKIVEQTLDELRQLDAGSWKNAKYKGEKIPTMEETIASIPEGKRLVIEIKCGAEVLPELERVLKASGRKDADFVIIGFSYETVKQAKLRFPNIPVLWLSSFKKNAETGALTPSIADLIRKAKSANLDGLNLNFNGPLDAASVQQIKDAGLKIYVWTVNDAAVAKRLVAAGVEGITTDKPQWLREQIAK